MLYSRSLLVTCFIQSSVSMSIPTSQFIPLPQPLVTISCFLHLWLYFCFINKFICTLFSFLDSTYKQYHMISVFLCWLTSLSMTVSMSIHVAENGVILFFFMAEYYSIVYIKYVPHLFYPFLSWWTFSLFPSPGYCKQCCNEHWGASIFLNFGYLWVYAQEWNCWGKDTSQSSF